MLPAILDSRVPPPQSGECRGAYAAGGRSLGAGRVLRIGFFLKVDPAWDFWFGVFYRNLSYKGY